MIADMVGEVIHHRAHVLSPNIALPQITKALKGFTAKRANEMPARTGNPFWQEESYDHLVRDRAEWERIKFDIEQNPVLTGLVRQAREYGGRARGGRP